MTEEKELEIKAEQIAKVELGATGITTHIDTPFGMAKATKQYKDMPKVWKITGNISIEITRKDDGLIELITVTSQKPLPMNPVPPTPSVAEPTETLLRIKQTPSPKEYANTPMAKAYLNQAQSPKSHKRKPHYTTIKLSKYILDNRDYFEAMIGKDTWFTISEIEKLIRDNPQQSSKFNSELFIKGQNGSTRLHHQLMYVFKNMLQTGDIIVKPQANAYATQYKFYSRPTKNYMQEEFKALQDTMH